jgi:hypothetical protein
MGFNNFDLNNFFPFVPFIPLVNLYILVKVTKNILRIQSPLFLLVSELKPLAYQIIILLKKLAHSFNVILDIKNYILK